MASIICVDKFRCKDISKLFVLYSAVSSPIDCLKRLCRPVLWNTNSIGFICFPYTIII